MADGRKLWRPRKPVPPGGSSPSPPNQAAKAKTLQMWSPEQMGLVSNPDTCWLPIQRDDGGSGVQVWDHRRLDMNSDQGLVWYPRQATGSPPTPCRPPQTRPGSPAPWFGSPSAHFSSSGSVTQVRGYFGFPPARFA
ncbi:hypothetical protein HanXRQr2_Chr09g0368881 [Helianthus annuus]|uniref:Uncharacterized protein n=1 Tax=Helianthus annuus TaxID=4232 RepID=A0A9K3N727_HELAN|nr:hypothetical protein HanXRQr2_Chr09g0368881 [Helianthus annuus]